MDEQIEQVERADHADELGFERLVFFSDAVLAIAITLMALEIRIPELEPEIAAEQIGAALAGLIPHIFVYVLSFLVIGIYWIVHHRLFRVIRRFDTGLMWLNLIFLMSVAFLPVATNALGTYIDLPLVNAFYAVSVALVGLVEFALWGYAVRKGYSARLSEPHSQFYYGARILTPSLVFLFSIVLMPLNVNIAQLSWALMIPITLILQRIFKREHAERHAYEQGGR